VLGVGLEPGYLAGEAGVLPDYNPTTLSCGVRFALIYWFFSVCDLTLKVSQHQPYSRSW
jgi:hypothetical protein